MNFVIGFFLGRWIGQFFYFMFAHPILFLIGLVRFVLVLAALIVGIGGPVLFPNGGWGWVIACILVALLLLFFQRKLRDLSDRL